MEIKGDGTYRKREEENGEGKRTRLDVRSHLNTKRLRRTGWIRALQHSGS